MGRRTKKPNGELNDQDKAMIQTCLNCKLPTCHQTPHCDYGKKYGIGNPATLIQASAGIPEKKRTNLGMKDIVEAADRYIRKHNIRYEEFVI